MHTEVMEKLHKLADEKYKNFSMKFLPAETPLLGVRIPILREYAKKLVKEGRGEEYLKIPLKKLIYQEEFMLHGMILGKIKFPTDKKLAQIKEFVPYISNWAVCDIFCADLKETKKNPYLFYQEFQTYTLSKAEYQIRFFYVMALNYFLIPELIEQIFIKTTQQTYVGFYDKMAAAWMLSIAYIKFPQKTENFLTNTPLDTFVFRKSISKICDSFRVTKEAKAHLRALVSKRKINLYK